MGKTMEWTRGTAAKHSPRYPLVGMEEPKLEWNGWSMYRHGQQSILDRYLITPKRVPVLDYGMTVLDLLLAIAVAALLLLLGDACGMAFDSCADRLGW